MAFSSRMLDWKVLQEESFPMLVEDKYQSCATGGHDVESVQLAIRDDKAKLVAVGMVDANLVKQ